MNECREFSDREEHAAPMRGAFDEIAFEVDIVHVRREREVIAVFAAEMGQSTGEPPQEYQGVLAVRRDGGEANHGREEGMRNFF
ncbi:MAG: hypothetical protein JOZ54_21690 [Acidobacteria bacterium]|nr:hypothetical protein [Acidobacteriota bacterium]